MQLGCHRWMSHSSKVSCRWITSQQRVPQLLKFSFSRPNGHGGCQAQICLGELWIPRNSHDSTSLWGKITGGKTIPHISKDIEGVKVPPLILRDSAFIFQSWLIKPYTSALLTSSQQYFNYRLSRARMVIEEAYGELKGRWRVLQRKCESAMMKSETTHVRVLCCITFVSNGERLYVDNWMLLWILQQTREDPETVLGAF